MPTFDTKQTFVNGGCQLKIIWNVGFIEWGVYMKTLKLMCLIIVLLGLIPANSAWARGGHGGGHHGGGHHGGGHHFGGGHHHGGHHFGGHHFGRHHFGGYRFGWGLGLGYGLGYGRYWPYYSGYYSPYYCGYDGCYPPPVYIQRGDSTQAATGSQSNYWHYCSNPKGYYPQVKKCPDGWLPVAPQLTAQ